MKRCIYVIFYLLVLSAGFTSKASAGIPDYLCELGRVYYAQGNYSQALDEFHKALTLDPENAVARLYVEAINKFIWEDTLDNIEFSGKPVKQLAQNNQSGIPVYAATREAPKKEKATSEGKSPLKVTGEYRLGMGINPDGVQWKRANGDLNERNWRVLSNAGLNRFENTYDPRIFDRFSANLDTQNAEGFNFHSNITIDPWSFTGTSPKVTITSGNKTDTAEIELKYWSNTGRTINQTVYTLRGGDSFNLPEIKVENGRTSAVRVTTTFGGTFDIPSLKIEREFQPIRELWFDYKTDVAKLRFFPIAYSDQALNSDDPLGLSNHHIYWEESPWILAWQQGNLNTGATPKDFSQGKWDDSLAFFTRDSDMARLTALRGFSFDYQPLTQTSFQLTAASPKGLWQSYENFYSFPLAMRLKQGVGDTLMLGSTYTYRLGLNEEKKRDVYTHTWGFDAGFSPFLGTKLQGQLAGSFNKQDLSSPGYTTESRGFVYQVALLNSSQDDILGLNYGQIRPKESDKSFFKSRFHFTHMDAGFTPALASYRETRDDQFWSRHIHFRKPFKYYLSDFGVNKPPLSFENDIAPYAIGDGIDVGRDVLGFRLEASTLDRHLDQLFDVRNVHKTNGKFLENVTRSETTLKATDKLTAKLMLIYHKLHRTYGNKDPVLTNAQTDRVFDNNLIPDDKSPSMNTFSLGLNYNFFEWLSAYGIYEYTNDINGAYDAFPRGILNSSSFETFRMYDSVFRRQTNFVYNQQFFPLPPYPYNGVYKLGLTLRPMDKWEIFLDYTRNEYEYAGQISDDINHLGAEIGYKPTEKLGFFVKYVFSQVKDLIAINNGKDPDYQAHHNFFFETRYNFNDDDQLTIQYGEGGIGPVLSITNDPFGGSLMVLDTQHTVRLFYRRKF